MGSVTIIIVIVGLWPEVLSSSSQKKRNFGESGLVRPFWSNEIMKHFSHDS